MSKEIRAIDHTLEVCLRNKQYYIDFYQREYVWNKQTTETLLNDIWYTFDVSYNEHKDKDLNEATLNLYSCYYLNVFITNEINGKIYIVDGQQRLTTLTLIALKLYHLTTDEIDKDILRECIMKRSSFSGNVFIMDNDKRKSVMQSLYENTEYTDEYKNRTEKNLIERYEDISRWIDNKNFDKEKLKLFILYFLNRLILVELSINQDDTPMVFEVINDRGEDLKPFEILKGKLIGSLSKEDTDLYSEYWDKYMSLLSQETKEDNFFIDYIKAKYIYTRNTSQELAINREYHRFIFANNDIADDLSFRKQDTNHIENIKRFIKEDLNYYTTLYAKIIKNDNAYLEYNNTINGLSGQYENILAACKIKDGKEDEKIVTIAKEIDRLWILLILNGIYDSNNYQKISYRLNKELKYNDDTDSYRTIFNTIIKDTITERRNINQELHLLEYSTFLKRNYENMNKRVLRYLFARIEDFICRNTNQQMQNPVLYISTKSGEKTAYHIEHILSNNDNNRSYFQNEEEFLEARNQLGGLLLLKGLNNISSGNEEYVDKLKTYSHGLAWGHSLCDSYYHSNIDLKNFNNYLKENYQVEFKPYSSFDKNALEERNKLLYTLIKIIWEVDM
ncbi:MAG: DUF262 domain-containing protein [Bacteroidales bacterium]|nr:DUF262 domain-containing protein [Bacteroidales bacterium]